MATLGNLLAQRGGSAMTSRIVKLTLALPDPQLPDGRDEGQSRHRAATAIASGNAGRNGSLTSGLVLNHMSV